MELIHFKVFFTPCCSKGARQDCYTTIDSIPSSCNHQNIILDNNLFEVARYADHTIGGNITNFEDHQNVTPANNLFGAGGAAHVVNDNDMEYFSNHYTRLTHTSQDDVVGNDNGSFESEISQIEELISKLTSEEGNIRRELLWLDSRTRQKRKSGTDVDGWLEDVEELKARANEMIKVLLGQGLSLDRSALEVKIKELIKDLHTHIEQKPFVLSNELMVGKSFYNNLDRLSSLVKDENFLLIGVHGMGGVGKTTLVTHFKNEALRKRDFEHVIWVTVSQDFNIFKLQSAIAKRIGIKLDEDDEIVERAQILSSALEKRGKLVLILDDVWSYIDVRKVGIPLRVNGIKLILTSRLKYVFEQMDCQPKSIIPIKTLSRYNDEDWELFLLKLSCYGTPATLSPEKEEIARSIVKRCDGLPLGIGVMAKIMKGVKDIRQWRHALNKLENSSMGGEMEQEVFKSLKLSYDHLMDKNIQKIFLLCSLYNNISENELIRKLVDEGLIKGMKSLEEIVDEGHAMLDQLKGQSLLLDETSSGFVMNDLMRDMARYVVKGRYMVKCESLKFRILKCESLTKIPDMQEWAHDLEKVSLMGNDIKELPEGTSPRCPQLSTLILSQNKLSHISHCFFSYLEALTTLDLSDNTRLTSLPNSLSRLRSLKSLLLRRCCSLKYVPPLWDLQELIRLDISDTSIEQVPEDLPKLVKLRWLDLSCNPKLTFKPCSMLFGLTNMQFLDLCSPQVRVEVEALKWMSGLEYFAGFFRTRENIADYVENILDRDSGPKWYQLFYGIYNMKLFSYKPYLMEEKDRCHLVRFGDCEAVNCLLPRDLDELHIHDNQQWSKCLCDVLSFKAPSSLKQIRVYDCPKLERLFCLSGSCSFCKHLHNLRSLSIMRCHNMEKVLTPVALWQLPNMEEISVKYCESMKEIIATRSSDEDDNDNNNNNDSTITFPKYFKKLVLESLPHLEIVCTSIIVCESPPIVIVDKCPSLIRDSIRYKSSLSDPNNVNLLPSDIDSSADESLDVDSSSDEFLDE